MWEKEQVESISLLLKKANSNKKLFEEKDGNLRGTQRVSLGPDTGGLATDSAAADWMKFREIMFDLYSVLDYAYFLLHCHFANGGCPDHSHEALHCGFPLKVKGVPT